jgi:Fe-S cluster biogenesis protein NfuA
VNVNANGNGNRNDNDNDLAARIGRIETLIDELENLADPAAQAQAREVVAAVLDYHGAALANLLGHVAAAGPPGRSILESLARDDLVSSLLLLHGLHPHDLDVRVARALDRARPQLRMHGGDVELLGIAGGIVRLRMMGSCHGCPSSTATLTQTIEAAIYESAPEVVAIEVEGVVGPSHDPLLPVLTLGPALAGDGRQGARPA